MKFDVIYADPPWPYETWRGPNVPNRRKAMRNRGMAEAVYNGGVMTLDDIKALPVAQIAAKSAALVMWTTGPRLNIASEIAAAWGFDHYSTVLFSWLKTNPTCRETEPELLKQKDFKAGIGYWTQSNVEIALLFLRGTKKLKRQTTGVKQVIVSPIREHSEKPVEAYDRIRKLFGDDKKYLEMFGRRLWPNWTVIGDEVERGQDIRVSMEKLIALDLAGPPKTSVDLAPASAVEDWQTTLKPFGNGITGQLRMAL